MYMYLLITYTVFYNVLVIPCYCTIKTFTLSCLCLWVGMGTVKEYISSVTHIFSVLKLKCSDYIFILLQYLFLIDYQYVIIHTPGAGFTKGLTLSPDLC